jgi:choline dehydrogenase-like flavoprotein
MCSGRPIKVVAQQFDFVVVGGGSAGAVIASRLSEDPQCRLALIEAGERPPEISALPIAPPVMQLNPTTDWMFTADPGKSRVRAQRTARSGAARQDARRLVWH